LKPYYNPYWGFEQLYQQDQEKREKKKKPKIVAYLSLRRWSHALCLDQKFALLVIRTSLGPKVFSGGRMHFARTNTGHAVTKTKTMIKDHELMVCIDS
jgi:hypothetical protein